MVTLMRIACESHCDTQYTDRQTNIQTDQQLTHPPTYPSVGRRVRAYKIFDMWCENRECCALRSEVTS